MKKIIFIGLGLLGFALNANGATWSKIFVDSGNANNIFNCNDCKFDKTNDDGSITSASTECLKYCVNDISLEDNSYSIFAGRDENYNSNLGLNQTRTYLTYNMSNVKQAELGINHSVIVKNDDTVWTVGAGYYGALGLGDTSNRTSYTQSLLNDVKECNIVNYYNTICVKNDGTVWGTGRNSSGQLGVGDTTQRNVFTQAIQQDGNFLNNVKKCTSTSVDTLCIKNNGELYYSGSGTSYGFIATNRFNYTGINNVFSCSADETALSIMCVLNNGLVISAGGNTNGQLSTGDNIGKSVFVYSKDNNNNIISNVKECVMGIYHSLCVKNDGTVWASGMNGSGQLGLGDTTQRNSFNKTSLLNIKNCATGRYHTICIDKDGKAFTTGYNNQGQLGISNYSTQYNFIQAYASNVKNCFRTKGDFTLCVK